MKKFTGILMIFCLLLLTACGNSSSPEDKGKTQGSEEKSKDPVVLKMNMVPASTDDTFPLWEEFAKQLEDASEGTLKMEVYPSETLGKTTDMIEAISKGAPILQDSDPSHLSDYVDDFSVFMHPYLFKEPADIEEAWKSEEGQRMVKDLEEKGLKVVTMVYFGSRHLLSDREVITREDTKGMKIRNAPTKMWNEVSKTLGGNPTNTAWSEVYTALSQGVADGAEAPLSLLYSSKLFETRDHISLTGHLVATTTVVMSKEVYDSLPPEAQKAIEEVGSSYPAERAPIIQGLEKEFEQKLKDEGVKINEVEKDSFIQAAEKVSDAFPEWTPDLYEKILKSIE